MDSDRGRLKDGTLVQKGHLFRVPGSVSNCLNQQVTMQNTLESYSADASVILNINYSSRTSQGLRSPWVVGMDIGPSGPDYSPVLMYTSCMV